jgi:hypothetical protein
MLVLTLRQQRTVRFVLGDDLCESLGGGALASPAMFALRVFSSRCFLRIALYPVQYVYFPV